MDKYCQNCNQANPSDAAFCRNCAATLNPNPPGNQQNNNPWNQQNPTNQQQFNQSPTGNSGESQKAIISLVLAIAGFFCCSLFTSIPAAILGWMEVGAIKRGESSPAGLSKAQIGMWGGIAVTVLHIFVGVGYFILVLLAAASTDPYGY